MAWDCYGEMVHCPYLSDALCPSTLRAHAKIDLRSDCCQSDPLISGDETNQNHFHSD